ncbi:Flavin-dependent monooxygenase, oxygenase subunit HsaA [Alphaproteobacteria bacterium SO-S41]|nr:Flavin-dependent monooxygenase, oxygenase subunit HsaA [Alphaproteobacteria bacterium SO-S41]
MVVSGSAILGVATAAETLITLEREKKSVGGKNKAGLKTAEMNIPGPDDYLTSEEVEKLTPEIVIERVRALKPLMAKHRREAELRAIPIPEVWNALRKTGYYYLTVPKIWGGLEASFDQMLDATFAVCEADPAMGWLASFSVMNPRSAAAFSDRAHKDMYGNGEDFVSGRYTILNTLFAPFGEARKVDGGWRVSGTWSWGTTVQMADWVSVMCFTGEPGPDGVRPMGTFLMPVTDVTVLDTWTADGLVATGTHKVLIEDVFVPEYRTVNCVMTSPQWINIIRERFDYPVFKADLRNALSTTISVALVGIARGAVQRYTELLQQWTKRGDADIEKENQASQIRLAQVHAAVQGCEIQLRDIARRTYEVANEPAEVQVKVAEKIMCEIAYVGHTCRDAVLEISKGLGTSAHYVEEPMSQFIRDIVVGSTHGAVNWDRNMAVSGRALLGVPQPSPKANARMS